MSEISSLIQTNWQELGTFLVEVAFLIAGVWFAHNILKAMRAFQEQIGALLKLSITPSAAERESSPANARSSLAETSPYWLTPSATETAASTEAGAVQSAQSWMTRAWHGVVAWMNEPMTNAHAEAGAWHRFVHWLRTPAGS